MMKVARKLTSPFARLHLPRSSKSGGDRQKVNTGRNTEVRREEREAGRERKKDI